MSTPRSSAFTAFRPTPAYQDAGCFSQRQILSLVRVSPPSQSHRRTMGERLQVALLPDAAQQIQILDLLRMAPSQRWTPACTVLSQGWPAS